MSPTKPKNRTSYFKSRFTLILVLFSLLGFRGHENVSVLDLGCEETACFIPVDPDLVKALIPDEHQLFIRDGKAEIIFLIQDCTYALLNGINISPLEKMHTWIRLAGPDTIAPVPGAQITIPTFYWWDYSGMSTNNTFLKEAENVAVHMERASSIDLAIGKSGKIIQERNKGESLITEWLVEPAAPGPPTGINHIVYGHHKNMNLLLEASGTIYPMSQGGKTKIITAPGTDLALFGTELYGISYDFTMSFKAIFYTFE